MKAPTFEQLSPWTDRFGRVAAWLCWLGSANALAISVVDPDLTPTLRMALLFWWAPPALANLIVQHVMLRWAKARLRESLRLMRDE